jgi:hypothetical protein
LCRGIKSGKGAKLGQEFASSQVTNARTGGEQVVLALAVGMVVDGVLDELFGVEDLLVEKGYLSLQLRNDSR